MKRNIFILSLLFSIIFVINCTAAVKPPTEGFYANDYANVLNDSTINYIISENDRISGSGTEIVVTTIDFTDGRDIQTYATDMFNSWKIGDAEKNNGVLLLLSIGDDDYWLAPGVGIDRYMDAGTIQGILDEYLEPDFAEGNYDEGVRKTFDAICAQVERIYDIGNTGNQGNTGNSGVNTTNPVNVQSESSNNFMSVLIIIVFLVVLLAIITSGRRRVYYGPSARVPWFYFGRRRHHHHHHGHHGHHGHMPPPPPPGAFRGGSGFGGNFNQGTRGGGISRGSGAGRSTSGNSFSNRPSGGSRSFGGGAGRSSGGGSRGGGGISRGSGAGRRK